MSESDRPLRVALVGPCASGKSLLAEALRESGYDVHQPAQEHSYVPAMWQKLTRPDILIYLDVNFANVAARRPKNSGPPQRLEEQHQRLHHARQHCDFYLDTSDLSPAQVQTQVSLFLAQFRDKDGLPVIDC
jgi:deoxyadenosine/deoxycytidine kinase